MSWDYFRDVIPLLERDYHLYIPAIPGYDLTLDSEFTSVEAAAQELERQLLAKGVAAAESRLRLFDGRKHRAADGS